MKDFIKRVVWHFKPVTIHGVGNVVKLPKKVSNSRVFIVGNNNHIEFAEDALLTNTQIIVYGDGCTMQVAPKARFLGPCAINLTGGGKIVVGENCGIRGVKFECCGATIKLGKLVMFSYDILLRNHDSHKVISLENRRVVNEPQDIEIGNHVWICESAKVLKGVRIGDDSIVAFGALVTKDVGANSIVAGIPGKVVKTNITWDY